VHRALLDHAEIPAPALVAHGRLYYDDDASWPYLVTRRMSGVAWRDADLTRPERLALARRLGEVLRAVHALPVPSASVFEQDWLVESPALCVERHREWRSLPDRLIDEIEDYLVEPSGERRLVHADVTSDHVFVVDGRLEGIIDWGDAVATDPHYELVALHLDVFRGDKALLRAFLDAYGWPVEPDFARRAMSCALLHRFDVLATAAELVPLDELATLNDLATALWEVDR
jgi:aminoglycoside phosphotransferase (APT) family kinase protein